MRAFVLSLTSLFKFQVQCFVVMHTDVATVMVLKTKRNVKSVVYARLPVASEVYLVDRFLRSSAQAAHRQVLLDNALRPLGATLVKPSADFT